MNADTYIVNYWVRDYTGDSGSLKHFVTKLI